MKTTGHLDPYTILGLSSNASDAEIERAFQRVQTQIQSSESDYGEALSTQSEQIAMAYQILRDIDKRRRYDRTLAKRKKDPTGEAALFNMRITPSKRVIVPLGEPQVMYLLTEVAAPPNAAELMDNRDAEVNLALVLDHSKSMSDEGRMAKVKAAAQTIITDLKKQDVISLVAFNDRASTIIPATHVTDKMALRARVSMIEPRGGTEIYHGLQEGVRQIRQHLDPKKVNHIILLTDGQTFGDEDQCIALAHEIAKEGISISAMGLGSDWNDEFLDQIATITGGTTTYIKSVNMVQRFMDQQVRSLSKAFAERVQLSILPSSGIQLEMAFKLAPGPQPLDHSGGQLLLSSLQPNRPISVLLQFQLPAGMPDGYTQIARIVTSGNLMLYDAQPFHAVSDFSLQVSHAPQHTDGPPNSIVDALSKLTLYRMQQQAQDALERGDVEEATRKLQMVGTRLIEMGEVDLGRQAMAESQHVAQTRAFSDDASGKTIKYATRALIQPGATKDALTSLLGDS